jgi:hypothetical protein
MVFHIPDFLRVFKGFPLGLGSEAGAFDSSLIAEACLYE